MFRHALRSRFRHLCQHTPKVMTPPISVVRCLPAAVGTHFRSLGAGDKMATLASRRALSTNNRCSPFWDVKHGAACSSELSAICFQYLGRGCRPSGSICLCSARYENSCCGGVWHQLTQCPLPVQPFPIKAMAPFMQGGSSLRTLVSTRPSASMCCVSCVRRAFPAVRRCE